LKRISLAGRLAAVIGLAVAATAAVTGVLAAAGADGGVAVLVGLLVGLPVGWGLLTHVMHPINLLLQGLIDSVRSFQAQDFSVRLAVTRHDELGQLVHLLNAMGDALRAERMGIHQKEVLLDSIMENTPMAVVMTQDSGRVVYANQAARDLLGGGQRLQGHLFSDVMQGCAREMREVLERGEDALFTVEDGGQVETYHVAQRSFLLNTQRHRLCMVKRLTRELNRQEVEIWKKVIRIFSHELNNSLAPISSLVHSARLIAGQPEHAHRLQGMFDTVEERTTHLRRFLEEYASFVRLPAPQRRGVPWRGFLESLSTLVEFQVHGELPDTPGYFDAGQIQQVLINLLKNSHEAGTPPGELVVLVDPLPAGAARVSVLDRGRGMQDEEFRNALVPFYSTKVTGSGVGLPLSREIIEAHGGRLRLQQREGGGMAVTFTLAGRGAGS